MAKKSNNKEAAVREMPKDESEEEIPPDILEYKKELEEKTGKKYKYRPAKKDLPSVGELLAHGVPGQENKPKTWKETVGPAVALALVFGVSLVMFHHFILAIDSKKEPRKKEWLNQKSNNIPPPPFQRAQQILQNPEDRPEEQVEENREQEL